MRGYHLVGLENLEAITVNGQCMRLLVVVWPSNVMLQNLSDSPADYGALDLAKPYTSEVKGSLATLPCAVFTLEIRFMMLIHRRCVGCVPHPSPRTHCKLYTMLYSLLGSAAYRDWHRRVLGCLVAVPLRCLVSLSVA